MLGHDFPRLPLVDPEGSRRVVADLGNEMYQGVQPYQIDNQVLWLMAEEEQISLYEIARGYHNKPETAGYVLEFGSWCGGASILMTKAMIERNDGYLPVTAVDPYRYHPDNPFSPEMVTYLESWRMHHRFGEEVYYGLVRVVSEDLTFMRLWNNPIRLVFIDTTGQYEHTKAEVAACLPFLVDDSWLLFHDYYEPFQDGLIDAIDEFIQNQTEWEIQPYKLVDEIKESHSLVGIHFIEKRQKGFVDYRR